MNRLFVLSGASGSGKSRLLEKIVKEGLCKQAPKYSNREKRSDEFDDITHIEVDELKKKCDIRYQIYMDNIWYGINTKEIKEELHVANLIVIISDIDAIKAIKALKKDLGIDNDALIVFIYLQDLCIDNLLKERYDLNLDENERKEFANHILKFRDIRDKNWLDFVPENIKKIIEKLKSSFPNNEKYQEFIKRCDSWIDLEIKYEENKDLFTDGIISDTVEELYDKFESQIYKKYIL